jgi:hypothetical protein
MAGCFNLGELSATGDGATQDFEQAASLYREACDGRHAEACYGLGVLYQNGTGVARQPARAAALIRRACDLGYADACPTESGS